MEPAAPHATGAMFEFRAAIDDAVSAFSVDAAAKVNSAADHRAYRIAARRAGDGGEIIRQRYTKLVGH